MALKFLLAAEEICLQLSTLGYWVDFVHPYSGQPFLSYSRWSEQMVQSEDPLLAEIHEQGGCLCIRGNEEELPIPFEGHFSGRLFTNAPYNWEHLQEMITLSWIFKNQTES